MMILNPTLLLSILIPSFIVTTLIWSQAQATGKDNAQIEQILRKLKSEPTYIAERNIVTVKAKTRRFSDRIAKKNGFIWHEIKLFAHSSEPIKPAHRNDLYIFIKKPDGTQLLIDVVSRAYTLLPQKAEYPPVEIDFIAVRLLEEALGKAVTVLDKGEAQVGTFQCTSTQFIIPGSTAYKLNYYLSTAKPYTLIKFELFDFVVSGTPVSDSASMTITQISYEVPDELFQVPAGFHGVDNDEFFKLMRSKQVGQL